MLEGGTDIHTIQRIAGHKRVTTTADTYLHISTEYLKQAALPM